MFEHPAPSLAAPTAPKPVDVTVLQCGRFIPKLIGPLAVALGWGNPEYLLGILEMKSEVAGPNVVGTHRDCKKFRFVENTGEPTSSVHVLTLDTDWAPLHDVAKHQANQLVQLIRAHLLAEQENQAPELSARTTNNIDLLRARCGYPDRLARDITARIYANLEKEYPTVVDRLTLSMLLNATFELLENAITTGRFPKGQTLSSPEGVFLIITV